MVIAIQREERFKIRRIRTKIGNLEKIIFHFG